MFSNTKSNVFALPLLMLLALLPQSVLSAVSDSVDTTLLKGLEWRLVGPYRGGRVTTVTGVPDKPMLYYMGATGGGVWKTENAGTTWENISDEFFKVGTIGAVAVAESDNNVLYVGTGEVPIRGVTTSQGDGMWKSTDAGTSWQHVLKVSANTGATDISLDPSNPRIYCGGPLMLLIRLNRCSYAVSRLNSPRSWMKKN